MKVNTDKKELKELGACSSGYKTFIEAHGENKATLSQCLESSGWDDVWWLMSALFDQFSDQQKIDLRLLGCEYALSSIENFEKEHPEDDRPRKAIEAAQAFAKGEITEDELSAAESAAWSAESAAESAWSAARSAAWSARSAESAARSAWSAARSAAMEINNKMLKDLFLKWESQVILENKEK